MDEVLRYLMMLAVITLLNLLSNILFNICVYILKMASPGILATHKLNPMFKPTLNIHIFKSENFDE